MYSNCLTEDPCTPSYSCRGHAQMQPTVELAICTACLHLLANGEDITLHNEHEVAPPEPLSLLAGADVALGGEELGFERWPCDGCGDTHHGQRFTATQFLVSMTKVAA